MTLKLDESTARRHLKSPRSLSGRSLHLTLVIKWSWSWMTYSHPFVQYQSALPLWDTAISKFDLENPWSRPCVWSNMSKVRVTFDLENSKVMVKFKPIGHIWGLEFNRCLLFRSVSPGPCQSDHFWLRYSIYHICPWKFKVKVMGKAKSHGHIWGLRFNWYICFSFRGNRTIFGWDIANSIFDLENSRSRLWPRSKSLVTFEDLGSIDIFVFCFVAIGPFLVEI